MKFVICAFIASALAFGTGCGGTVKCGDPVSEVNFGRKAHLAGEIAAIEWARNANLAKITVVRNTLIKTRDWVNALDPQDPTSVANFARSIVDTTVNEPQLRNEYKVAIDAILLVALDYVDMSTSDDQPPTSSQLRCYGNLLVEALSGAIDYLESPKYTKPVEL